MLNVKYISGLDKGYYMFSTDVVNCNMALIYYELSYCHATKYLLKII